MIKNVRSEDASNEGTHPARFDRVVDQNFHVRYAAIAHSKRIQASARHKTGAVDTHNLSPKRRLNANLRR